METVEVKNDAVVNVTLDTFLSGLSERVSQYDARLILNSAIIVSGLKVEKDSQLKKTEAETICLELIKKGGPAFQVGANIYRQYVQ